ncbi:MAG: CHAT domain-containing protein, partial [Ferruginibacter sp.]|nr:CHAT domain-containing protein [Chitinophagaceae bacterium]
TKNKNEKKFARVACPAAGTKLASNRLATIFNVFFNLLGGNANPFVDTFKTLIAEAVKTKDDVKALPGLEAMNPESPFIKILNDRTPEAKVDDVSLAIISGNSKTSLNFRGLKVIAIRLFFQQRNDLVVNTDSMYLGTSRSNNIQYFFDEGGEVDHIKYFSNPKTREALLLVLKTPDGLPIQGFTSIEQLKVAASDRDMRGLEHGELFPMVPSGKKPIVILLPGIMGSNLGSKEGRIWINYWKFLTGGLINLEDINDPTIAANSLVRTSYKKLAEHLSFNYDVVVYPFDWRKQLNECARDFNNAVTDLLKLNQPIKIIGHSMGGVLVRDFIIRHKDTWNALNATPGFRILFLGSPLGGSYRIPAVLFGNDTIINSLSGLDQKHTKKELIAMFSAFPGILSLLPLTNSDDKDFAKQKTWEDMRHAFGDTSWPIPGENILNEFKDYRDGILAANDTIDYTNMVYIAGKDKYTPCDYFNNKVGARNELVFLYTGEGDQSVTWDSGIPPQLTKNGSVYYSGVSHGALANEPVLFDAIEDILAKGTTLNLSKSRPVVRGEEKKFRMNEVHNFDLSERGVENAILGLTDKPITRPSQIPLRITLSNGDLTYAAYPVLAGHFKNDGILNAEKAIDWNLSRKLSDHHALNIYPGDIGTSEVFADECEDSDFQGAVIIGLGEPGKLTGFMLTKTVEQGVANYLLSIQNESPTSMPTGISALMIGCGYGGLPIETSIKAIIEGVNNANRKILDLAKEGSRIIQHIEFIELYEDRALNCMYALSRIENKENKMFNINIGSRKIKNLFGLKKRLPVDDAEQWWNRITVKLKENGPHDNTLLFGSTTGDAREEEKELFSSTQLIDLFLEQISTQDNWNERSAKSLFELMIPNEFKDRLKRKGSISWVLNKGAANYPWELLQDDIINAKPLCVNAGMIRQLTTSDFRLNIKRVANEKALIIGDPQLNGYINQLSGAEKEAREVEELMKTNGYACTSVISKPANDIVRNLFCDDYKIIHLAGHGIFDPASPRKSGMVIGKEKFLTTFDINQMSATPELVFVNCCHLGKVSGVDEKLYRDRYKLAANIGTQLIEMGVKAVVVAGWKVNDDAAYDFARIFYNRMFEGAGFGDAVKDARSEIFDNHGYTNTWGAYQCYGDPFYRLINRRSSKSVALNYLIAQEAEIDLGNLRSNLDTRSITTDHAAKKLKEISEAVDKARVRTPDITEKEAFIYGELSDYKTAIAKFIDLFKMENAQFSVAALEKFCKLRIEDSVASFFDPKSEKDKLEEQIDKVIKDFDYLLLISSTAERFNLLGSAYKRKAVVGPKANKRKNMEAAAFCYYQASQIDQESGIYSLVNWYILEAIIRLNAKKPWVKAHSVNVHKRLCIYDTRIDRTSTDPAMHIPKPYELSCVEDAILRMEELKKNTFDPSSNMDYWRLTEAANLQLCELVLNSSPDSEKWKALQATYIKLWKNAGSSAKRKMEVDNLKLLNELLIHDNDLKKNITQLEGDLRKLIK